MAIWEGFCALEESKCNLCLQEEQDEGDREIHISQLYLGPGKTLEQIILEEIYKKNIKDKKVTGSQHGFMDHV